MLRQILQVVALLIGWFSGAAGAMERPNILVLVRAVGEADQVVQRRGGRCGASQYFGDLG